MKPVAWDEVSSELGRPEHVHAIGAFAVYCRALDQSLYGFFEAFIPEADEARAHLFSTLQDRQRTDLVKRLADKDPDKAFVRAVHHAMRCFEICAENRNLILQAAARPGDEVDGAARRRLLQDAAKDCASPAIFPFNLKELREAALSARKTRSYSTALCAFITLRTSRRPGGWPPLVLPQQPRLPRKLRVFTLGVAAQNAPSPPPTVGGELQDDNEIYPVWGSLVSERLGASSADEQHIGKLRGEAGGGAGGLLA